MSNGPARAQRHFAGERQARRGHSEAFEAKAVQPPQPVPGRRTLTESLEPAPVEVVRTLDTQLEIVSRQLAVLEAANQAGDHHASGTAAATIRVAFKISERVVAMARAVSEVGAAALASRLADAREAARPGLELAFTPSPAARREAVQGAGREQWDREVAAWRAARGRVDLGPSRGAGGAGANHRPPHEPDPEVSPQHATAAQGVSGAGGPLPYLDLIQRSFGRHDVTGVRAHIGGAATQAARALGATAYAAGSSVAFAASPDLHTAAHEAAHVVQQRARVMLDDGIGAAGDHYEQHADAVADRVVAGGSAESLLDAMIGALASASPSSFAIQRKEDASAARLSGQLEDVLLAAVRIPVREGDAVRAWQRFEVFLSWLPRLSPADQQILLRRLEKPAASDELAWSFHQLFRPEWQTRALEILRSGGNSTAQSGSGHATPAPRSSAESATVPAGPWDHMFEAASMPVNKLGRIQASKGRTLLQHPSPESAPSVPAPLLFDTRVMVVRRTTQPTAAERWCYVTAPDSGAAGFCEERYLAIDPPDPHAKLRRIESKETLGKIARDVYGTHITGGNDERLYVQGLYEANKDRTGVKLTPVELSRTETWHRKEAEEKTLEVYRGVEVLAGLSLWIPSNEFMQRLKASGAITSGSSELSKAWRAAAELVDDAIEAVKYAAGFIAGLLEGAWSAIVDLFKGAAEMVQAIAKIFYHLVTDNPGRIKDMLMKWVDKMKSAWEHRGEIADEFMKKWNARSGWDRGRFQGEVLGWVMMTVLLIIATAGSSSAASAGSLAARFPQAVKLLKTVDAAGDVTTYLGGAIQSIRVAGKVPGAAVDLVKRKLDKANPPDAARTSGRSNEVGSKQKQPAVASGVAEPPDPLLRGGSLSERQIELDRRLAEAAESMIEIGRREVTATDLAALTRKTGMEHAVVILRGNKRLLVRLDSYKGGRLPANTKRLLMHSHPDDGGSGMAKFISAEDVEAIIALGQRYSYMVTIDGTVYRFTQKTVPYTIGEVVRKFHPIHGWVGK